MKITTFPSVYQRVFHLGLDVKWSNWNSETFYCFANSSKDYGASTHNTFCSLFPRQIYKAKNE